MSVGQALIPCLPCSSAFGIRSMSDHHPVGTRGLYSIVRSTIDYDKMTESRERMKEFQRTAGSALPGRGRSRNWMQKAHDEGPWAASSSSPMTYILVLSVPIFFWLLSSLETTATITMPISAPWNTMQQLSDIRPGFSHDLFHHTLGHQEGPLRGASMRITVSAAGSGTTSLSRRLQTPRVHDDLGRRVFRQLAKSITWNCRFGTLQEGPELRQDD